MAIVVYAPSLALAQVTGINMDLSIGLTFLVGGHPRMTSHIITCNFIIFFSPQHLPLKEHVEEMIKLNSPNS